MTQDTYTENLADFGAREREIAGRTLLAALPDNFGNSGVKLAFNKNSGNVFLVNDDYQVAMLNDDVLGIFHSTPYSGLEGFLSDLMAENNPADINSEDAEYIWDAAQSENCELPANWVNHKFSEDN